VGGSLLCRSSIYHDPVWIRRRINNNSIRWDCSFVHVRSGRGVVTPRAYCAIGDIDLLGDEADLGKLAGLFQVTIRDGSLGVVEGDKVLLDVLWEGLSPHVGGSLVIIEDSSHAGLGCVRGAQEGGVLWYYLCKVSGSVTQAGRGH
jgi:hypothetical protein